MGSFGRTFVRQLALTLASQATVGLVGLVRIPLAIDMLGVGGYALLASYSAAAAWLIAPASANRQYALAFGGWPPLRLARRMKGSAGLVAIAVAVGLIGFALGNLGNSFVATEGVGTVMTTFGLLSLFLAMLSPGGARLGRFEAWYGVWLFPILEIAANVMSLGAVFALSKTSDPNFSALAIAWILPIAMPYAAGMLLSSRLIQRLLGQRQAADSGPSHKQHRTLQPYLWITLSPLVASGLDLFIVGALLASEDVAALALVTRLSTPLLIVPTVIRTLVVREVGQRYTLGNNSAGLGRTRRTVGAAILIQGAIALAFVGLGPPLFELLSDGQLAPPLSLFPVTALLFMAVLVFFVLLGLGSSPEVVPKTARITAIASFATAGVTVLLVPFVGIVGTRLSPLASVVAQALLIRRLLNRPSEA